MIQVKEMMQDERSQERMSKDKDSRSRSQSMNEQSRYKQEKTKTRPKKEKLKSQIKITSNKNVNIGEIKVDLNIGGDARMESRELLLSIHHSLKMLLDIISKMNMKLEEEKVKKNDKRKEKLVVAKKHLESNALDPMVSRLGTREEQPIYEEHVKWLSFRYL
ncbi:hypothetical protein Tco_1107495 [Tanacetum coccineum]